MTCRLYLKQQNSLYSPPIKCIDKVTEHGKNKTNNEQDMQISLETLKFTELTRY